MATLQLNGTTILTEPATTNPSNPVAGQQYYNTTSNLLKVYNGTSWKIVEILGDYNATGGTFKVFTSGNNDYLMHIFTESGFFTVTTTITDATVMLVGGGGSGGASAGDNDIGKGGGGAGAIVFRDGFTIAPATYEIGIGKGGYHPFQKGMNGATNGGWSHSGAIGRDTHFCDETTSALIDVYARGGGGGGGGDNQGAAVDGGCGGGGGGRNSTGGWNDGANSNQPSFSNWASYGYSGGNSNNGNYSGGGGGGAGGTGGNYVGGTNSGTGGYGGVGRDYSSYFGIEVGDRGWFAGGGGGCTYRTSNWGSQNDLGIGGKGGGGNGLYSEESSQGNTWRQQKQDGMDGTGGGGGGAGEDAVAVSAAHDVRHGTAIGSGGDGIVIVRYKISA
jgi:hypothetical protein